MEGKPTFSTPLAGTVYDWVELPDVNALIKPRGLEGTYTFVGIDPAPAGKRDAPEDQLTQREYRERGAFRFTVSPEMSVLHLMQLAAREHVRRHCRRGVGGHVVFERMEITDRTIEFVMGS
jgi:hypothetical protein